MRCGGMRWDTIIEQGESLGFLGLAFKHIFHFTEFFSIYFPTGIAIDQDINTTICRIIDNRQVKLPHTHCQKYYKRNNSQMLIGIITLALPWVYLSDCIQWRRGLSSRIHNCLVHVPGGCSHPSYSHHRAYRLHHAYCYCPHREWLFRDR